MTKIGIMQKIIVLAMASLLTLGVNAETRKVYSPDGRMQVSIIAENGTLNYEVSYDGKTILQPSSLGLKTDMGDYSQNLTATKWTESKVDETYTMSRTKAHQ